MYTAGPVPRQCHSGTAAALVQATHFRSAGTTTPPVPALKSLVHPSGLATCHTSLAALTLPCLHDGQIHPSRRHGLAAAVHTPTLPVSAVWSLRTSERPSPLLWAATRRTLHATRKSTAADYTINHFNAFGGGSHAQQREHLMSFCSLFVWC